MKIIIRPEPDLFDLEGWRGLLAELREEPADVAGHDIGLAHAETMVDLLEERATQSAAQAR